MPLVEGTSAVIDDLAVINNRCPCAGNLKITADNRTGLICHRRVVAFNNSVQIAIVGYFCAVALNVHTDIAIIRDARAM